MVRANDLQYAQNIWFKIEKAIYAVQDGEIWDETLYMLGWALAQASRMGESGTSNRFYQKSERKDKALIELKGMLIYAGQWDRAERLISS